MRKNWKSNMFNLRLILLFTLCFMGIRKKVHTQNTVPYNSNAREKVGWIAYDKEQDRPDYFLCDEWNIEEYYQVNPLYKEGMPDIRKYFEPYQPKLNQLWEKDGYIIVRFIINCKGETDRYRTKFMNLNYEEENQVNEKLKKEIKNLVSTMGKWTPGQYMGKKYDCYQHLKFLFRAGKLTDILF
jgi:hypothetical protein